MEALPVFLPDLWKVVYTILEKGIPIEDGSFIAARAKKGETLAISLPGGDMPQNGISLYVCRSKTWDIIDESKRTHEWIFVGENHSPTLIAMFQQKLSMWANDRYWNTQADSHQIPQE